MAALSGCDGQDGGNPRRRRQRLCGGTCRPRNIPGLPCSLSRSAGALQAVAAGAGRDVGAGGGTRHKRPRLARQADDTGRRYPAPTDPSSHHAKVLRVPHGSRRAPDSASAAGKSPHHEGLRPHPRVSAIALIAGGAAPWPRLEGWLRALMVRDGAEESPPHHEDTNPAACRAVPILTDRPIPSC